MRNRDKKCVKCGLPVYAKDLCRKHYKSINSKTNNTSHKVWLKIKSNPFLLELKRESNAKYRIKKKLGIDTTRKANDNLLINRDWQKYASLWTRKTNYLNRKSRKTQENYHRIRLEVMSHYSSGVPKCKNCGVEDERVLTLDHINNDGNTHRRMIKQLSVIYWIVKNNYPPMFQVLCHNCNWLKELDVRKTKFDNNRKEEYKPIKKK